MVVSADLSHYKPYDKAVALDQKCIKAIEAQKMEEALQCETCGLGAIHILLTISKAKGWQSKILDYKNSGDTAGPKDRVVGYSSILFFEEKIHQFGKKHAAHGGNDK